MNSVLIDTSVWVDHFRRNNEALEALLIRDLVMIHPFILGEIACGTPPNRQHTLADLHFLCQARQATFQETMDFIEREHLYGVGFGLVDLSLLASTLITPKAELWTLDKRLGALAKQVGVMHQPAMH